MKKIIPLTFLLTLFTLFFSGQAFSQWHHGQLKGNGHIIKTTVTVPVFHHIEAGEADNIILLKKGNTPYSVVIETDENLQKAIRISVSNQTLHFSYSGINPTRLKFIVTVPDLSSLEASGAAVIKGADTLSGQMFEIRASGAANINMMLDYTKVTANASGATDVHLSGKADTFFATASGAADIKAGNLAADSVFAKATGASDVRVNAQKFLKKNASTAATIRLVNASEKKIQIIQKENSPAKITVYNGSSNSGNWNDTTRINIGSIHLEVVDGDTTKITVGSHRLIVDDNGDVKWKRIKPAKFNGHWGGVDLGFNGYFTPGFSTDFGKAYAYLNQQYEKSINVNLNLFEQNIAFNKAKTIGMITGIGFAFNDYRFSNPTYLSPDSNMLSGFYMRGVNVRKSKLSVFYLSVPVLFEFQTNNIKRSRRLFVNFGVIINARLRTHTKIYFNEANKQYYLEEPATGNLLPGYYTTPNRTNRNIVKSVNSFNLQPFRFDATVRFGYGMVTLYATYALNKMFLKGQGPDLNQWSAGISVSGW